MDPERVGLYGPSTEERLRRLLGDLYESWWPAVEDDGTYLVDVGVACVGTTDIAARPNEPSVRRPNETDRAWAGRCARYDRRLDEWQAQREETFHAWDDLKAQREREVQGLVSAYGGRILALHDALAADLVIDSFTVRLELPGAGIRDLVLNHPHVFEVVLPDDIVGPEPSPDSLGSSAELILVAPADDAPVVGVIDSGIQENHVLLAPAIDRATSVCFLPGESEDAVADHVGPGGHGTRVAGAVLFGEQVPAEGRVELSCWIQNARVLDASCQMPRSLPPAIATRAAILRLAASARQTRLLCHAINANAPCRTTHMSAWAAEIDAVSHEYDVLVIQSIGNLPNGPNGPQPGIVDHLDAGRGYPDYLDARSSRVANPAQSLQALTVGSVAYQAFEDTRGKSFATRMGEPSGFTRSGPGIWDVQKPEVVELGGDLILFAGEPSRVATPPWAADCYPQLVRATLHGGPSVDRDAVGTSFAAPKVAHIAAMLQAVLPEESTLLYRALIVQSARWPSWAEQAVEDVEAEKKALDRSRQRARRAAKKAAISGEPAPDARHLDDARFLEAASIARAIPRRIGYGLPDVGRATGNSTTRVTLVTSGMPELSAEQAHIYVVPVPAALRDRGPDVDVRVEVTLSYSATPRRTRRTAKRYLAVWLDWKTSGFGEPLDAFQGRVLKVEATGERGKTKGISWVLGAQSGHGGIKGLARSSGTLQKDWTVVSLRKLGSTLGIAVVGHKGWSRDPDAVARYALAVSFEVVGEPVAIYDEIRAEVEELQAEVEVETFVET